MFTNQLSNGTQSFVDATLYEAVIGIEVHVQLKTDSKIFSADSTRSQALDNENTNPVSLGMPGTLPVLNKKAVDLAIKAGLALNCEIKKRSVFARKNYFYPDLSKGYQISQYDQPLCENGYVELDIDGVRKKISIVRAHMEEDAGKSTHFADYSLINYNRAGVPLLEVVSAPEIKTAKEAAEYCRAVRQIMQYADVCDGNLEEGSLRFDCNVSVKRKSDVQLGTKVELKNLNSFRFIEKAIDFEIERQIDSIQNGQKITQETRQYDPDKNRTISMRVKEDAQDYRYFPDPDLLALVLTDSFIDQIKKTLPELPLQKKDRLQKQLGLNENEIEVLTNDRLVSDYFEKVAQKCGNYKAAASWIMGEVLREINLQKIDIENIPIKDEQLAELISLIDQGQISAKMAKIVFQEMWLKKVDAETVIQEKGLVQVSDSAQLEKIIDEVLQQNPGQIQDYKAGKVKMISYFMGAVMKITKGQANPDTVQQILKQKLDKS